MMYTSLKLSKLLKENGCELESEWKYMIDKRGKEIKPHNYSNDVKKYYNKYDILWDICVKYAKEFFGEKKMCLRYGACKRKINCELLESCDTPSPSQNYIGHTYIIFRMLQQDKPQEEIEAYIIANSVFFNKKENN